MSQLPGALPNLGSRQKTVLQLTSRHQPGALILVCPELDPWVARALGALTDLARATGNKRVAQKFGEELLKKALEAMPSSESETHLCEAVEVIDQFIKSGQEEKRTLLVAAVHDKGIDLITKSEHDTDDVDGAEKSDNVENAEKVEMDGKTKSSSDTLHLCRKEKVPNWVLERESPKIQILIPLDCQAALAGILERLAERFSEGARDLVEFSNELREGNVVSRTSKRP